MHKLNPLTCIIYLVILVSGCSTSWKRIKPASHETAVRTNVRERMNIDGDDTTPTTNHWIETALERGISREEISHIALENLFETTAILEELGVAQADLVQAGIYKNPLMLNTINAASLNTAVSNQAFYGTEIDFSISDLWQLPKRKKVAQEALTIKQLDTTLTIINRIIQIQRLYDTCVALRTKFEIASQQHTLIKELIRNAQDKQEASIGEKATHHTLEATRTNWSISMMNYEQQYRASCIRLRQELALNPVTTLPTLTSPLALTATALIDCSVLEAAALEHSYEVALANAKINQAEATIHFEHSKFLNNFAVGYIFEKNVGGPNSSGLEIDLDLPIFDNNRAGVARARFERTKAYKELALAKRATVAKVRSMYTELHTLLATLPLYEESITHNQNGLNLAGTLPSIEVIYLLSVPSVYQSMYDTRVLLLDAYVQARDIIRQLEALSGVSPLAADQ